MALPISLPSELVDAFVRGARRGHEIAARAHLEEEGWDSTTFGTNRYRLSWYWTAEFLDETDGVTVTDRSHCLRARWGHYEFAFYNGGIGADWDPRTFEFDATARRAEVGFANMSPLPGLAPNPVELQHLIVTYTGSPERGCLRVYVGAPITDPVSSSTSWAWIEEVWSAPSDGGPVTSTDESAWKSFRDLRADEPAVGLRADIAAADQTSP